MLDYRSVVGCLWVYFWETKLHNPQRNQRAQKTVTGNPGIRRGYFLYLKRFDDLVDSRVIPGTLNNGTPFMVSFPYYSHTTPIRIPKDMGMVWEASHKGVPEKIPLLID